MGQAGHREMISLMIRRTGVGKLNMSMKSHYSRLGRRQSSIYFKYPQLSNVFASTRTNSAFCLLWATFRPKNIIKIETGAPNVDEVDAPSARRVALVGLLADGTS